jgi:2'-5' RNA ligase
MRLFVAVPVGDEARDPVVRGLGEARRVSPPDLRWIAPENWHFTLQFLGPADDAVVAPLQTALRRAAARHRPFEMSLAGAGAFPNAECARVVWVGVPQGAREIGALAANVARETATLGFVPEERAFQAHLTVARLKRAASVAYVLAAARFEPIAQAVRELVLYRSYTERTGARYEALVRVPFGA